MITLNKLAFELNLKAWEVQELIMNYFPDYNFDNRFIDEEKANALLMSFNEEQNLIERMISLNVVNDYCYNEKIIFHSREKIIFKNLFSEYIKLLNQTVELLEINNDEAEIYFKIKEIENIQSKLIEYREIEIEKINRIKTNILTTNDGRNSHHNNIE